MKTSSKYDEFHLYFRTREEFRTDPVPMVPLSVISSQRALY